MSRLLRIVKDLDLTRPTTPTGLQATPTSETAVSLSWNAATDPQGQPNEAQTGVVGYRLYRNSSLRVDQAGLTFGDTGLSAYTVYSYDIRSYDAAGNESIPSAAVNPRTLDTTAPTAPTVTASQTGQTSISVALTAPSTDSGSGVSTYRLEYKRTVDGTWSLAGATLTVGQFPVSISGLLASTSYDARAQATDVSANVGSFSATSSATTQSSGGALPLGTLAVDGPPTPEQIALVLPVTGTISTAATTTAACRYRVSPAGTWITGHPLYRIRPNFMGQQPAVGPQVVDDFAWTILGLTPGTAYDVEVTVTEQGVGSDIRSGTFTTRSLPATAGAQTHSIAAGSTAAQIAAAFNAAPAGSVVVIQGNCNIGGSSISLTGSGTQAQPKYLRGLTRSVTISAPTQGTEMFSLGNSLSDVVIENLTFAGDGVDKDGASASDYATVLSQASTSGTPTRVTMRQCTGIGLDRVAYMYNAQQMLIYDCTMTGNNLWQTSPVNFLGTNRTWNDDGLNLAGFGNCGFNNTLVGFGDTLACAQHAGNDVTAQGNSIHFYRNEIRNGCDDGIEADHGTRNVTCHDNRFHNTMTATGCDPLYGGPAIFARNVWINPGSTQMHKWNDTNSGMFLYYNTVIGTAKNLRADTNAAQWYQPTSGDENSWGCMGNVHIGPAGTSRSFWMDASGHNPIDFGYNAWGPESGGMTMSGLGSFTTIAQAASTAGTRPAVFAHGVAPTPNPRVFRNEILTVAQPWTTTITLGANSTAEVTQTYLPVPLHASIKNNGVVIPNITDGFTGGAQPDRGAIIAGRAQVQYGDRSITVLSTMAASLAPGQSRLLGTIPANIITQSDNTSITIWGNKICYDPINRVLRWIGKRQASFPFIGMQYSEATNTWSNLPLHSDLNQSWNGHGYDHNAVDPATGDHYFRPYGDSSIYRRSGATGTWSIPTSFPSGMEQVGALEWVAGRGLCYADGSNFQRWNGSSWTAINGDSIGLPSGTYQCVMVYNAVAGVMMAGGGAIDGNICRRYNSTTEAVTAAAACSIELGTSSAQGTLCASPTTAEFIAKQKTGSGWRRYSIANNQWTTLTQSSGNGSSPQDGPPNLGTDIDFGQIAGPIPQYGVQVWIEYTGALGQVWLYRPPTAL